MPFLGKVLLGAWLISAGLLSLSGEGALSLPSWMQWLCWLMLIVGIIIFVLVNMGHEKPHRDHGDLGQG